MSSARPLSWIIYCGGCGILLGLSQIRQLFMRTEHKATPLLETTQTSNKALLNI
jgi:hypothetical protein